MPISADLSALRALVRAVNDEKHIQSCRCVVCAAFPAAREALERVETLEADLNVAREIGDSFWRALKPRMPGQINVADPGCHFTALLDTAQARVARLEVALHRYGVHFAPCPYAGTTARVGPQEACSCGLTAALEGRDE